jgi:hypothetical protein
MNKDAQNRASAAEIAVPRLVVEMHYAKHWESGEFVLHLLLPKRPPRLPCGKCGKTRRSDRTDRCGPLCS